MERLFGMLGNWKNEFIVILYGFIIILISGCASVDRITTTTFEPLFQVSNNEFDYFKYIAPANLSYPIDSTDAEQTRILWLETWLSDNGLKEYKIIYRLPVSIGKSPLGEGYKINYVVKIKKNKNLIQ